MRKLTTNEKLEAPSWAYYYSISQGDTVFFVNKAKTESCSLSSPKLGIIELTKGARVYNNLAIIQAN